MHLVVEEEPGVLSVNYMWLPTWLGMNSAVVNELGASIGPQLVGLGREEALKKGHELAVEYLVNRFSTIKGLREYLQGVSQVGFDEPFGNQG